MCIKYSIISMTQINVNLYDGKIYLCIFVSFSIISLKYAIYVKQLQKTNKYFWCVLADGFALEQVSADKQRVSQTAPARPPVSIKCFINVKKILQNTYFIHTNLIRLIKSGL